MTYSKFAEDNGISDCHETSVLYQVYQDLRLIRKWSDVRVARAPTRAYLAGSAAVAYDSVFPGSANATGLDRTQVVVPLPASKQLTPRELQSLCKECVHPETNNQLRCITVAIVDDDSTTAYYRIFNKWGEIVHPQWKTKKARKEAEKQGAEERGDDDSASESDNSNSESD